MHGQCSDVCWLRKASEWAGSSGVQLCTSVRIQKRHSSIHLLGETEGRDVVWVT